ETYDIEAVSSPDQALKIAEEDERRIDLLISDVVMPGMGGSELTKRVRRWRPETRVILMSGYADRSPTMSPGMAFLQKPFTPIELEQTVRALLAAGRRR